MVKVFLCLLSLASILGGWMLVWDGIEDRLIHRIVFGVCVLAVTVVFLTQF